MSTPRSAAMSAASSVVGSEGEGFINVQFLSLFVRISGPHERRSDRARSTSSMKKFLQVREPRTGSSARHFGDICLLGIKGSSRLSCPGDPRPVGGDDDARL